MIVTVTVAATVEATVTALAMVLVTQRRAAAVLCAHSVLMVLPWIGDSVSYWLVPAGTVGCYTCTWSVLRELHYTSRLLLVHGRVTFEDVRALVRDSQWLHHIRSRKPQLLAPIVVAALESRYLHVPAFSEKAVQRASSACVPLRNWCVLRVPERLVHLRLARVRWACMCWHCTDSVITRAG